MELDFDGSTNGQVGVLGHGLAGYPICTILDSHCIHRTPYNKIQIYLMYRNCT